MGVIQRFKAKLSERKTRKAEPAQNLTAARQDALRKKKAERPNLVPKAGSSGKQDGPDST